MNIIDSIMSRRTTNCNCKNSWFLVVATIIFLGLYSCNGVSATLGWSSQQQNHQVVTRIMMSTTNTVSKRAVSVSRFSRGGTSDDSITASDHNNTNHGDGGDDNEDDDSELAEETATTTTEEIQSTESSEETDSPVDSEIIEATDEDVVADTSSGIGNSEISTSSSGTVSLISTSDSRLPMSITTVVADLEAEGYNELSTACLIVSKSVSLKQRQTFVDSLTESLPVADDDDTTTTTTMSKVLGYSNGLILANPISINEVSASTIVCNGTIVYYSNEIDIERGEGLFVSLAPAIETILKEKSKSATLYIIGNEPSIRTQIEKSAAVYLSSMVCDSRPVTIRTLNDVFAKVIYLPTSESVVSTIVNDAKQSLTTTTPESVSSAVATIVASSSSTDYSTSVKTKTDNDAINLAAARIIGPPARIQLSRVIDTIQSACQSSILNGDTEGTSTILVPAFGELCTAAVNAAIADLTMSSPSSSTSTSTINNALQNSDIGKQIKQNFLIEIDSQLTDILEQQFIILQQTSFEQCKKQLSKLLISPNLQNDMYAVLKSTMKSFTQTGKTLIATPYITNGPSMLSSYSVAYTRQLVEYVTNRLLSARVSGQYKPLPKKGITVGLHWLLPKPFGNDYRQEPWMVHSTDNMVYIPSKKLSDVDPNTDVRTGDWRTKIIPNPAGNDMLYMQ
jgi:hypothetical protein